MQQTTQMQQHAHLSDGHFQGELMLAGSTLIHLLHMFSAEDLGTAGTVHNKLAKSPKQMVKSPIR